MKEHQLRTPVTLCPPKNRTGGGTNTLEAWILGWRVIIAAIAQETDRTATLSQSSQSEQNPLA